MQTPPEHYFPSASGRSEEEAEFFGKLSEDFRQGLKLDQTPRPHDEGGGEEGEGQRAEDGEGEGEGEEEEEEEEDEDAEEFEFTFVCADPDGSPISAEEAFENGQIRPFYPVFGRNILLEDDASSQSSSSSSSKPTTTLKGILVKERTGNPSEDYHEDDGDPLEGLTEGTYCLWRGVAAAEDRGGGGGGACKKSNSTGFSKLWRVKDLGRRSSSDGKDAFVFLNPKKAKETTTTTMVRSTAAETTAAAKGNDGGGRGGKAKGTMVVRKGGDSHKYYYGRGDNKKNINNRRKSYLPYRVGFFTNVNGMSRNVHPY